MKMILLVVLGLAGLALAVCGGGVVNAVVPVATVPAEYAGKVNPLGEDSSTEGAKIFKINCEACHGPQGHGDGPAAGALAPQPKNLAELQVATDDDYLFWRISTGKEGTSMVAWKGVLTDEQIWQAVAFINTLK